MTKPTKMEIWHHNSLLGGVGMARASAERILNSYTSTDKSRAQAKELLLIAEQLNISLRTRRDQE